MLRIHIEDQSEPMTFILEGRLAGPWVAELEKCWHVAVSSRPTAGVVLKLAALTFVDDHGKDLLCRMHKQGVRLMPTGCLMKAIVEIIEADVCKGESA
jgi:hypothetical protein